MEVAETTETDTGGGDHETRSEDEVLPETTSLAVSESADADEAAAIAAAVGAHLRDRAAARAATTDVSEPCDRWKLRSRFDGRELPREITHGEEWKAAARSRWPCTLTRRGNGTLESEVSPEPTPAVTTDGE